MLSDLVDSVKSTPSDKHHSIGFVRYPLGALNAAGQQLCKVLYIDKDPFFLVVLLCSPDTTRPLSFFY